MKTAISLPDQVFLAAEEAAQYMGISRSSLYLNAISEYLEKNNHKGITEKLNEVYGSDDCGNNNYFKEFEPFQNVALESLRELTKNDTW